MPTTTNLNLTLPEPGAESSRGVWGTVLNTAITAIDTALANATTTVAGRMSAADKIALDSISSDSGVSAGSYGSSSQIPVLTINAKGKVTSASTASVSGGGGGVSEDTVVALAIALG